jgi:putative membrane protein
MKKTILAICFMAGTFCLSAQNTTAKEVDKKDMDFAKEAAEGGMLEVKLGQLAGSKGSSQEVKDLGKKMVSDHTKINDELKALAAKKNIKLPAEISKAGQNNYDKLMKKTGEDFDKAYCDLMIKDHEKDISKFKQESEKGEDPDLKSWAAKTLPTLEKHLELAKEANDKMAKK